ncbi:hypothetical protein GMSM_42630 [Geomonas sp. Red276]
MDARFRPEKRPSIPFPNRPDRRETGEPLRSTWQPLPRPPWHGIRFGELWGTIQALTSASRPMVAEEAGTAQKGALTGFRRDPWPGSRPGLRGGGDNRGPPRQERAPSPDSTTGVILR